eukprot:TRINITY_DN57462_c0_g1_i1.p1 TRINITY_DN57462_c0_g1~~TRINITY_DN57462_c0_g1_i1.p1  ORF type:complete len:241 (-),score=41.25 TRINITY_DN57462_c0_g1_i1:294-1016(-)
MLMATEKSLVAALTPALHGSRLALPANCSKEQHPSESCVASVFDDLLSREECKTLLSQCANFARPIVASFEMDGKTYHLENVRQHERCVVEDPQLASVLWERLKPDLEVACEGMAERDSCGMPVGINSRFRVLRYKESDEFKPHYDGFVRLGEQSSLLSLLFYLNDGGGVDFSGGTTRFLNADNQEDDFIDVEPAAGRAVVFEHRFFHSGTPASGGEKLCVRTDVLFNTNTPSYAAEVPE